MSELAPIENITGLIYLIRGKKVMLDRDLASLYGVETKRLKEQVKRNIERFKVLFKKAVTIGSMKEFEETLQDILPGSPTTAH